MPVTNLVGSEFHWTIEVGHGFGIRESNLTCHTIDNHIAELTVLMVIILHIEQSIHWSDVAHDVLRHGDVGIPYHSTYRPCILKQAVASLGDVRRRRETDEVETLERLLGQRLFCHRHIREVEILGCLHALDSGNVGSVQTTLNAYVDNLLLATPLISLLQFACLGDIGLTAVVVGSRLECHGGIVEIALDGNSLHRGYSVENNSIAVILV